MWVWILTTWFGIFFVNLVNHQSFSSLSFHHRSLSLSSFHQAELRRRFHQLSSDDGSISWAPTTVPSAELRRRFHYLRFDDCSITWAPTTAVLSHGKYMLCISNKKISYFNLNLCSNSWIFSSSSPLWSQDVCCLEWWWTRRRWSDGELGGNRSLA